MCGIVGFVGTGNAVNAVVAGLKSLEYRGYDSAGIAFHADEGITVIRSQGRVADLEARLPGNCTARTAVGHTRWATHGVPSERNAHPHSDPSGMIVLVHNGIIENYAELKAECIKGGNHFSSDTDTEVIAHLIAKEYAGDLPEAVEAVLPRLKGTFALGVLAKDKPDMIVAARRGSPLAVGCAAEASILASDAVPILSYTNDVLFVEDDQVAVLTPGHAVLRQDGREIEKTFTRIEWSAEEARKGGYPHFMLKEIFEQPGVINNLAQFRLSLPVDISLAPEYNMEGVQLDDDSFKGISRIVIIAQGTAYYAGMAGRNMLERIARVPAYTEFASDFRYRDPILDPSVLVIAVTQSGETMDTLHGVRLARSRGCTVLSIVNAVGSSIARESDAVVYMHCGPEIGVASTKAFTAMIASFYVLAMRMGLARGTLPVAKARERAERLLQLPEHMETILSRHDDIKAVALKYTDFHNFLFLGRGTAWPLAMEGALKLKEISYIHAEGYDAAEMKHGPIALIDDRMPTVAVALKDWRYDKMLSNIQEIKARSGRVIAIASESDDSIETIVDDVLHVPSNSGMLNSILIALPMQLFAYYIAAARGCDVDKPKNLAKSVTVE